MPDQAPPAYRKHLPLECRRPPSSSVMNRSESWGPCPGAATAIQGIAKGAMPRQRISRLLRTWPRKYTSRHQVAAQQHNLRVHFIRCIERLTPEVVEDLARDILPHYRSAFKSEATAYGSETELYLEKRAQHHAVMAEALIGPTSPADRWDGYEAVREHLIAWADRYRLGAAWVVEWALHALLHWTSRATRFLHFELSTELEAYALSRPTEQRERLLHELRRAVEALPTTYVTWPIEELRPEDYSARSARVFEYPAWEGDDIQMYTQVIKAAFGNHLTEYLSEIRAQAQAFIQLKPITKPERFEMLALYICRNFTTDKIAEHLDIGKDPSGILRDIREAAKLIDLPLYRKPGRPPKRNP
jgi:hypothetical protein